MKNKLKAAGIHFVISILLISITVGLILYYLFPNSMTDVSNFKEIALLIISIDLILGPLLTFIVFKPKKKSLVFDLSSIAIMQIAALVFGLYNLYQEHPVFIAFNVDRFTLVSAADALPERAKLKEFQISKLSSSKMVVAKIPEDTIQRDKLMIELKNMEGASFVSRSEYYQPYEKNISEVLAQSLDPKVLFQTAEQKEKLNQFIDKYGKTIDSYAYLPLVGAKDAIWVLNKKTAKPIDIISINPWIATLVSKNPQSPIKTLKKNLF